MLFADLGADVIKVEGKDGDSMRQWPPYNQGYSENFASLNRSKRSIVLDLKDENDRAVALELMRDADLIIENNRPGVMDRLGLGYEAVRAIKPEIVYCSISAYGQTGPRARESGTQVGIVTGIVGIVRTEIIFEGEADHAGTTPMDLRRDALVAAAQTVLDVRKTAEDFAARYFFVATTGVIRCEPNASNVVPGRVRLIVEARSEHQSELSAFVDRLDDISMKAAMVNGVRRGGMKELSRSRPAPCNPALQHILRDAAADLGISSRALASGAGHDAAFIGRIAPMAMIFVPSKGGRSHCPDEWTSPEQCASGASVLLEALMRIDRNDMNHDDQGLTLGETAGETK